MTEPAPRVVFRVDATHPALPGHFPGAAIVPGVVVLEHVVEAAERVLGPGARLRGVPQVKFPAPLLPGVDADIALDTAPGGVRFVVRAGDATIAQGVLSFGGAR